MPFSPTYLLLPVLALLLVSAQAIWGGAIKNQHLIRGGAKQILFNLVSSPRIWIGAVVYVIATAVYFILLSKLRFFSVQISMMSISIIFSTLLAYFVFHESLSGLNILGMLVVLGGLYLVLAR